MGEIRAKLAEYSLDTGSDPISETAADDQLADEQPEASVSEDSKSEESEPAEYQLEDLHANDSEPEYPQPEVSQSVCRVNCRRRCEVRQRQAHLISPDCLAPHKLRPPPYSKTLLEIRELVLFSLGAEFFLQDGVDLGRVGLASGFLHDLTNEKAYQLVLAGFVLRDLTRIRSDDTVDDSLNG